MRRLRVVVAEDEALSRKRLVRLLQEAGCVVVNSFAEGRSAQDWLITHREVEAAVPGYPHAQPGRPGHPEGHWRQHSRRAHHGLRRARRGGLRRRGGGLPDEAGHRFPPGPGPAAGRGGAGPRPARRRPPRARSATRSRPAKGWCSWTCSGPPISKWRAKWCGPMPAAGCAPSGSPWPKWRRPSPLGPAAHPPASPGAARGGAGAAARRRAAGPSSGWPAARK